jgi:hypothetical protein
VEGKGSMSKGEHCIQLGLRVDLGGTWPVCLLAAAALAGWWFSRDGKSFIARIGAGFLSAVGVGLVSLCALMFVFNTLQGTVDPRWLRDVESRLIDLYLKMGCVAQPKIEYVVVVLLAAVLVGYVVPQLRLVTHLSRARRHVTWLFTALTSALTFTFFSSVPLKEMADDAWKETRSGGDFAIAHYRARLREEWTAVGEHLAANAIQEQMRELSLETKEINRKFVREAAGAIDERIEPFPWGPRARSFEEGVAWERMSEASVRTVAEHFVNLEPGLTAGAQPELDQVVESKLRAAEQWLAPTPATLREWQAGTSLIAALQGADAGQDRVAQRAELRANEAKAAAKEVAAEVLGLSGGLLEKVAPEGARLLGLLVEAFAGEAAGRVVEEWLGAIPHSRSASGPRDLIERGQRIRVDWMPAGGWFVPKEAIGEAGDLGPGSALKSLWVKQEVARVCCAFRELITSGFGEVNPPVERNKGFATARTGRSFDPLGVKPGFRLELRGYRQPRVPVGPRFRR